MRNRVSRPRSAFGVRAPVLLLICVLCIVSCGPAAPGSDRLQVMTSISPLVDIVAHVGGNRVQVRGLVPVGADPHDFEPRPQDVQVLSRTRLFFANGLGEEAYLDKLMHNAGNKQLRVVTLSDGLPTIATAGEGGGPNPHLWLSVRNVIAYVERIRAELTAADPAGASEYAANAAAYRQELEALDAEIRRQVDTIPAPQRKMVVFHDAWPYFCKEYGLQNLPLLTNPEAEPSAREYADMVDRIRAEGAHAVFGEAGFNPKLVQRLAADTGVRFVDGLYDDTLGDGEAATYTGMMRVNVRKIVAALK